MKEAGRSLSFFYCLSKVAGKLVGFMNRGSTLGAVNVPEINVGRKLTEGMSRVLSFHKNSPGERRSASACKPL
jgi:hypothetical protein